MLSRAVRWRPASRAALILVGLVAAGQVVALADPARRPPTLFVTVVLLDVLGVVVSLRAARRGRKPWPWRLVAMARAAAVAALVTLLWYVGTGDPIGCWTGVALRTLEFTLLAAATFASRPAEIRGRNRLSFAAEITDLFPWGGLVLCVLLMVVAVMVHMTVALRTTRDQVVDLDDFKLINDAYGHAAGDTVLTEFGHHLRAAVRVRDTCARIGGDEFAVLLLGAAEPEVVAQRVLAALAAKPVHLGEDTVTVHASIGLTENRPDDTVKDLMQRADLAMYAAKRLGTHSWMRHDPSMVDRRAMDAALAEELAGAAGRGGLVVFYQPIVDIASGVPRGYEALVRWRHPARGMVTPLDFIPAAERTGLIYDIGLHYLTRLPVDILKIDRSFVAELDGAPTGSAITEAIVRPAQALRLHTVAEGIETAEQAAELRALGCFSGQGYLYAPPRPAAEALFSPRVP